MTQANVEERWRVVVRPTVEMRAPSSVASRRAVGRGPIGFARPALMRVFKQQVKKEREQVSPSVIAVANAQRAYDFACADLAAKKDACVAELLLSLYIGWMHGGDLNLRFRSIVQSRRATPLYVAPLIKSPKSPPYYRA